jgi:hypothetical protein
MTSSSKIDVHVKDNGQEIGYRRNSPVRRLPDGTAGIVVSGLVYALFEDHSIDLAEEGTPKADCPEFFQPGEDLVYAEAGEAEDWWFFEETRWRSYLAFDGSEAFAERLNAAFEEEGLSDGYRESFRPAKNGHFYDYFIRLPSDLDEADVRRIVGAVSEKEHGQDTDEAAAEHVRLLVENLGGPLSFITRWTETVNAKGRLEQEIEGFQDSDRRQRQELEAVNAELQREREERRRLSAQLGSLKAERDLLQSELKASRDTTRHADVSWDDLKSEEIDRLSKEVAIIREERDLSKLEAEDLKAEVNKTRERARSLESELEIHKAEQRPTEALTPARSTSSKKEKQILNDFLSGAFPRLVLEDSDLKALLRDFGSVSGCAKVMCDLQEGRDPPHLKPWEGIKGVFEVPNISTGIKGRERMGRIYFRSDSEGGKIDLAVQVKSGDGKQQGEFVKQRFR